MGDRSRVQAGVGVASSEPFKGSGQERVLKHSSLRHKKEPQTLVSLLGK